jgi:spermidine synthase
MQHARPGQFGLIVLDAFSSDAIPMHLLTREAMRLYLSKLAPGGVMTMNISNVHLSLYPVVARVAQEEGLTTLWQREPSTAGSVTDGKFPSEWITMARDRRDLGSLTTDPRWSVPVLSSSTPLWTDDFSNILSVIRR